MVGYWLCRRDAAALQEWLSLRYECGADWHVCQRLTDSLSRRLRKGRRDRRRRGQSRTRDGYERQLILQSGYHCKASVRTWICQRWLGLTCCQDHDQLSQTFQRKVEWFLYNPMSERWVKIEVAKPDCQVQLTKNIFLIVRVEDSSLNISNRLIWGIRRHLGKM